MLYLAFLSFLLQDRLKVKDFPLSSRVSLHEWMLDMVSSCALTNEYSKMNKVCACAREERTLRLDNLMWQKLFHTEKLGWLLIDLIILLLYKDKGWMPSYLWRTKWTRLPQMREKTESILNQNGRFCSCSWSAGKLYLQTNSISARLVLFSSLMSDKAFIISKHP